MLNVLKICDATLIKAGLDALGEGDVVFMVFMLSRVGRVERLPSVHECCSDVLEGDLRRRRRRRSNMFIKLL